MHKPKISMIAALSDTTRAIGRNNELLWKISDDLKRFKALTTGHAIVMGRKTYESIGRPLPNRTNIIITRNHNFLPEGCIVVHSLEEALETAKNVEQENHPEDQQEIFIIGGGEIYHNALPFADRLYLTLVESQADGDTHFPDFSSFTKEISKEEHLDHIPPYTYVILEK
jgi:dihydrofolate reductase